MFKRNLAATVIALTLLYAAAAQARPDATGEGDRPPTATGRSTRAYDSPSGTIFFYFGRDLVADAYKTLLRPASTYGYRERTDPAGEALKIVGSDLGGICKSWLVEGSLCSERFIKDRLSGPQRRQALAAISLAGQRRECLYISYVDPLRKRAEPLGIGATTTRCFNQATVTPDTHPYCPAPGSTNGFVDVKPGRLSTTITYSPNQTRRIWNSVCRGKNAEVRAAFVQSLCDNVPPLPKPLKLLKHVNRFCSVVSTYNFLAKIPLYNTVGVATQDGVCLRQIITVGTFSDFGVDGKAVCERLRRQDAADTPPPATGPPVPGAVTGSWQAVAPRSPASVSCGKAITIEGAETAAKATTNGKASVRVCLVWFRSSSGTYYYQGALEAKYNQSWPGASDLFGGKSMSVRSSTGMATGIRDCPRISWSSGADQWCYSPTVTFTGGGEKLYAKGYLVDQAGGWHPVWSPTITTDAPPAVATPPNIPTKTTAQAELNALKVSTEGSIAGYSRALFPHWITISGKCDTRKTVLKREGSGVTVDGNCSPTSGSWYSQYDGVAVTSASSVEIDHVVPLAEAWRSGASSWTTSRRRSFANDLTGPQLIAVSLSSNRSKGDRDPSIWKPARTAYHCTYSKMWIRSKYYWSLRLQAAEKSALQGMLNTCTS